MKAWAVHPFCVAALVTGLNALKPPAVDDTAYLHLARNISAHPLDPYDGTLFWYAEPEPALHVLAPPVLPYWLAAGIGLFGERLPLLKLWLFPFPLILCYAVRSLARRLAPHSAGVAVPAVAFSPLVLPLFGVMLDVPALSLGLAAVAVFARGGTGSWLIAGCLAGLAMQTKYSAFVVPGVTLWYGIVHRRVGAGIGAGLVAAGLFAAWEGLLVAQYGESHFLYHARDQSSGGTGLLGFVTQKVGRFLHPLVNFLGGLGVGFALFAVPSTWPRKIVGGCVALFSLGLLALLFLPYRDTVFWTDAGTGAVALDLPGIVYGLMGLCWLFVLSVRGIPELCGRRPDRTTTFLTGWLLLEVAGYFLLTPFPAGRRVIGVGIAAAFAFFRAADRAPPARWVFPFGVVLGLGLFALDAWDARPENELAAASARYIRDCGTSGRVWYHGRWGFMYASDREGMVPVVAGKSRLAPGDWIVFPETPDDGGFYRPHDGGVPLKIDPQYVEPTIEFTWRDGLSGQTIPNLYGGRYPMTGRDHPRLRVVVYRVTREWWVKKE